MRGISSDFAQLKSGTKRVIGICQTMAERRGVIERYLERLERDNAYALSQITTLSNFLLSSFPEDAGTGDASSGESAVEVAMRLLGELKEHKNASAASESE